MNFKKIFVLTIAVLMMLTMLTACKEDKKEATSSVESTEATSVENTTAETTGAVEETSPAEESSTEASVEVSAAVSEDDTTSTPDSSEPEEISLEENSGDDTVEVAKDTYTVIVKNNGDGTVTVTAYTPAAEDVMAGKLVIAVSDKLTYVADTLKCDISLSEVNPNYPTGAAIAFAATQTVPAGCVAFTATYELADGASVSADDITAPEWRIQNSKGDIIANNTTKTVQIVVE